MKTQRKWSLRSRLALSLTTVAVIGAVGFVYLSVYLGFGPNLGMSIGYYGRLNQVVARIEASPEVQILETTLHRDLSLEDFWITVRRSGGPEVRLSFVGADHKPLPELLRELEKVGL